MRRLSRLKSKATQYPLAIRSMQPGTLMERAKLTKDLIASHLLHGLDPYHYCLFGLRRVPKDQWSSFIPDRELKPMLKKVNDPVSRQVVDDKFRFFRHCQSHEISTIPVLVALDRRPSDDPLTVQSLADWKERAADLPKELYFKTIDGSRGVGQFVARRLDDWNWNFQGRTASASDLYDYLSSHAPGSAGWLVQPVVAPHAELAASVSPHALGTARILSYLSKGKVELIAAVFRIPVHGGVADNFSHGRSSNLVASVDLETGQLGVGVGSKSRNWPSMESFLAHPKTNAPIGGFELPEWAKAVSLVKQVHLTLPQLVAVGWDVAFTDSGPLVVEGNGRSDADLLQVAARRGLRTELVEKRLKAHL